MPLSGKQNLGLCDHTLKPCLSTMLKYAEVQSGCFSRSNQAVSELLREIQPDDDDSNLYQVIWESEETAEFWIAFEAGF